ncbi:helix-turn-helix transcriptional regulator [Desulfogranum mediterraneum]|uniref:helix-turn-helix transcriptional regulator n=1 Tax=Desulfogranum mediterraneum TaxID=160661 RepID=UPI00048E1A7C|nr:helix-turn-helix transcriptional regulator [Desulfogranum mediterraneum]
MNPDLIAPRFFENQSTFTHLKVGDFSCVEYRSSTDNRKNSILVTSYLFVVLLSGRKIIHNGTDDLHIRAGNAFFAEKGSYLFSEILETTDRYQALIFFIDDSFLASFLKSHACPPSQNHSQERERIFQIHLSPLLQASIQSLLPFFVHPTDNSDTLMRLKLEELLLLILDSGDNGSFHAFLHDLHSTRKQNLIQLMEEYYLKPVSLKELAALSGRSLASFKRDFQKIFQQPPRQWINNRRLEQARVLLLHPDNNVSDTCFMVGFQNVSHFSQLFKKRFGCSPSALRP